MSKLFKILTVLGLLIVSNYMSYQHGLDIGLITADELLGPVLYKCVDTLSKLGR